MTVILAAAVMWLRRSRPSPWAAGLTLGGAAANTVDGAVQDFVVTGPISTWPTSRSRPA